MAQRNWESKIGNDVVGNKAHKNFTFISKWSQDEVIEWIKLLDLNHCSENFSSNHINGYDLCLLTNEDLKNELKVYKIHDRNLIIKQTRELLLEQCKHFLITT